MFLFHVEAVAGIFDVIQVHFFLCVLVTGSLLCGNARHLALLVSGRRGRRHWLSVSSFVMLSAFGPVSWPSISHSLTVSALGGPVQVLLFVPLRRLRFDHTVGLVIAFRLICWCAAVGRMCGFCCCRPLSRHLPDSRSCVGYGWVIL